jgi:hypothetical protein
MRSLVVSVLILLLTGCATPYQKSGRTGGYSETQLNENTFRVYFRGNAKTTPERAEDFALLRSAELSEEHGFPYFIIVDSKEDVDNSTYTAPVTTQTTGNAYVSGNTVYGNATTNRYGGQTYNIRKPSSKNTIVCFKEKPSNQTVVYEAKFIIESLHQKYAKDLNK